MMTKKFFGLTLAAITCVALNGNAQTNTCPDNACPARTECTQGKPCPAVCPQGKQCKGECPAACPQAKPCRADKQNCPRQSAFDKMNLSADQKTRLEQLRQKNREVCQAKAEACKAGKQRCDSTARADRQAAKRQYLAELKEIIGADNYVIFLEESFLQDQGPRMMRSKHHGKIDRKARKMDRKVCTKK